LHGLEECLSFADRETNVATILVKLAANDTTTPADIRKALADIREAVVRVSDLSMGIPFPVRFALTGPEREKLLIWAQAVEREIRQDGVATDPDIYAARQVPKLQIMIDRKRLQELGVSAPDAYKLLHDSVGIDVAGFNQIGRSIFLPVTRDKARAKVDYLKGLFVKNERGEFVPLSTFIEFRQAMAATAVVSVDGNPALRITAAVSAGKTADDTTTRCVEMAKSLRAKLGLSADYKAVDLASTKPR
jgi:multidrug efflux pump subunit AcrB